MIVIGVVAGAVLLFVLIGRYTEGPKCGEDILDVALVEDPTIMGVCLETDNSVSDDELYNSFRIWQRRDRDNRDDR